MSYSPKRAGASSSGKKTGSKPAAKKALSASEKKTKRALIIAIVAVLVVVILVAMLFIFAPGDGSFLGIRGSGFLTGGDGGYVPETQDGTTNISPYYQDGVLPTAADRHDIHLIDGGGANASELYGTWELDQATTYMFDGQGRGIMLTGVDNYTFNYSAENGKLGIDFDTIKGSDFEYDYTVSGDTLTMIRGSSTFTLKRTDQ